MHGLFIITFAWVDSCYNSGIVDSAKDWSGLPLVFPDGCGNYHLEYFIHCDVYIGPCWGPLILKPSPPGMEEKLPEPPICGRPLELPSPCKGLVPSARLVDTRLMPYHQTSVNKNQTLPIMLTQLTTYLFVWGFLVCRLLSLAGSWLGVSLTRVEDLGTPKLLFLVNGEGALLFK